MKALINRFFKNDYFNKIPADDILSRQRYKLYLIFSSAGMVISMAVAIQTFFLLDHAGLMLSALVGVFIIYGINYISLQYHERVKIAYAITVLSTFAVLHVLTYYSGGIRNSGTFYFGSIILCAFMLLGNRAGKLVFVMAAFHIIYFYYITENTNLVSNILVGSDATMIDQDFLITGILAMLFISAQCNSLEGNKNIVIQKITESRNELAEKNKELRKLSIVASKTDNAVSISDSHGVTEWINDGYTRLTGYTYEEVVGKNPGDLLYGEKTNMQTIEEMNQKLADKHSYSGELLKYRKDGTTIWMGLSITPIIEDNGKISKFIFIESDINERKEAEAKMEAYLNDLEKTNNELDKFAWVVSHDLKAPLRAIGNLAGWIEEDAGETFTEEVRGNFNIIKGRVARMEDLINGLLDYSKAHRKKGDDVEVNVRDLIKDTIEFIGAPKNCQVEIGNTMPVLFTDKMKMQQIFSNLLTNSIKYNDKEKIYIRVDMKETKENWEFSVEDNGPGIEPQYHEKIFVIFQTLNARDNFESTGVGLAIVKKIIEEEGGKIWVESDKGKGAKFYFSWPKNKQDTIEPNLTSTKYFQ